jgi:hypothetical protein
MGRGFSQTLTFDYFDKPGSGVVMADFISNQPSECSSGGATAN